MCFKAKLAGMGRYTYLPIRYYHDTWADTIFIVIFFCKNFDSTSIVSRYCYVLCFLFLFLTLDHGKKLNDTLYIQTKKHILAVTIAIRYYNLLWFLFAY